MDVTVWPETMVMYVETVRHDVEVIEGRKRGIRIHRRIMKW